VSGFLRSASKKIYTHCGCVSTTLALAKHHVLAAPTCGVREELLYKHASEYCSLQNRLSVTGASLSGSGAMQPQEVPSESIARPFMELRYQSRQSCPSVTGASNSGGVPTESIAQPFMRLHLQTISIIG